MLVAIGVASYALFVLATFPAEVAARWFAPDGLVLGAPSGTLWQGRAESLALGTTVTGPVEWKLRPWSLFAGRLSADCSVRLDGGSVAGRVAVTPTGTVHLHDVAGVVPLSALAAAVPMSAFDGRLGLDIATAKIIDQWLVDATGTIDLVDLRIVAPIEEALGSYEVAFTGADAGRLDGAFREVQANVGAEGVLTLHNDRRWEVDGLVSAAAGTSSELTRALALLGQRDAQGRYQLALSGEL